MEIPVPFLDHAVGSGDIVKSVLSAVGIEQKEGCGCAQRQRAMNRSIAFVPMVAASDDVSVSVGTAASCDVGEGYRVASGSIPPGMWFERGQLRGTPLVRGEYRLTVARSGERRVLRITCR